MVDKKINVLMVGSSTNVKGGMTTVVESFLRQNFENEVKIRFIPTHIDSRIKIYKVLYFARSVILILFLLLTSKIDIVHMHMSERGSFERKNIIYKISKFFNKKVITHTHGAEFEQFFLSQDETGQEKIKKLLRGSDLVIVLGENWEKIIKKIEPATKTIVLRNSINIPRLTEAKTYKKNTYTILFLAVLIERKGILDLINASKQIIDQLSIKNIKVNFIIAGDGELYKKSTEQVDKLGLNQFYKFTGWVNKDQKEKFLKESDIFVLPSYNEGLPMSILEALSYGLPVVSTNVGSINEAIIPEVNGYLIQPGDNEKLSESIVSLILDNEKIKLLSRNARKIAVKRFNNDVYFKNIKNVYRDIIKGDEYGSK